jgi:hypothetical protein
VTSRNAGGESQVTAEGEGGAAPAGRTGGVEVLISKRRCRRSSGASWCRRWRWRCC